MCVRIIVDSSTDVSEKYREKIQFVPLTVRFGDKEYLDGVELSKHQFYEMLVESDVLPTTSQATPAAFAEYLESVASAGDSAVVITLSSKLSGTYQSAVLAAEDYPNINQALSPNPETTRRNSVMDVQEYLLSWSDMNSYLKTGSINEDYIFRGLFVNNRDENSYKINKVDAVVYQIYDEYTEFCDSLALEGTLPAAVPVSKLKKVKNVFKVNDGIFEETGEIVLELSKNFDGIGDRLSDEHPNLLRVDFVVSEAKDNF